MKFSCNNNLPPFSFLLLWLTPSLQATTYFFQGGFCGLVPDFDLLWEVVVLFPDLYGELNVSASTSDTHNLF